jgi:hypothetical protein
MPPPRLNTIDVLPTYDGSANNSPRSNFSPSSVSRGGGSRGSFTRSGSVLSASGADSDSDHPVRDARRLHAKLAAQAAAEAALAAATAAAVGGGKNISFLGGIAFLINNVTGGGMVLFPQVFQEAGYAIVILALLAIMCLVTVCGYMLIESMAMLPGNKRFQRRAEYSSITKHYLPSKLYYLSAAFFQCSLLATNVSMIVQSCQVMDFTLAELFGRSCAAPMIYPTLEFVCPPAVIGDITVFGSGVYLIPLGWFLTIAIVLPLGFVNLDDNIWYVPRGGVARARRRRCGMRILTCMLPPLSLSLCAGYRKAASSPCSASCSCG